MINKFTLSRVQEIRFVKEHLDEFIANNISLSRYEDDDHGWGAEKRAISGNGDIAQYIRIHVVVQGISHILHRADEESVNTQCHKRTVHFHDFKDISSLYVVGLFRIAMRIVPFKCQCVMSKAHRRNSGMMNKAIKVAPALPTPLAEDSAALSSSLSAMEDNKEPIGILNIV